SPHACSGAAAEEDAPSPKSHVQSGPAPGIAPRRTLCPADGLGGSVWIAIVGPAAARASHAAARARRGIARRLKRAPKEKEQGRERRTAPGPKSSAAGRRQRHEAEVIRGEVADVREH